MSGWLERATSRQTSAARLPRTDRPILRAHMSALARRKLGDARLPTSLHALALGILQARRRQSPQ